MNKKLINLSNPQKFQMQEILNNMTDVEEIKAFEVEFKMLDFNS